MYAKSASSIKMKMLHGPFFILAYCVHAPTANKDFPGDLNKTLVLKESVKHLAFSIAIADDSLFELDEHFFIDLFLTDTQGYNITLDPNSAIAQITIIDDDGKFVYSLIMMYFTKISFLAVVIGFEPNLYTVSEGDGQVILTVSVLSGSLGTEVEIFLSTHGESAECESNQYY